MERTSTRRPARRGARGFLAIGAVAWLVAAAVSLALTIAGATQRTPAPHGPLIAPQRWERASRTAAVPAGDRVVTTG